MRRAAVPAVLLVFVAALVWAPAASAHARLVGTTPESGSTVPVQPPEVIFKYDQPVGGTEGAVRVYDSEGKEVDDGDVSHPGGRQSWLGVGLEPSLPDGAYTATYRVISADTHIVSGGLVFNLGHAGAGGGVSIAGLTARDESGEVTRLAIGVVRFLDYLSIALMVGGLIFLAFAWRPGFGEARSGGGALGHRGRGLRSPRRGAARVRGRPRPSDQLDDQSGDGRLPAPELAIIDPNEKLPQAIEWIRSARQQA